LSGEKSRFDEVNAAGTRDARHAKVIEVRTSGTSTVALHWNRRPEASGPAGRDLKFQREKPRPASDRRAGLFPAVNRRSIVASTADGIHRRLLHPVPAVLLGGALSLFLGALLSDITYSASYQVQWTNFASWLIVGGLVFSGVALLWALFALFRAERRGGRQLVYFLLLLAAWLLGFVNALIHARDAWAVMPTALILSVIVFLLALAATWIGFASDRVGDTR
jgi:uncharacterized membrane protein